MEQIKLKLQTLIIKHNRQADEALGVAKEIRQIEENNPMYDRYVIEAVWRKIFVSELQEILNDCFAPQPKSGTKCSDEA